VFGVSSKTKGEGGDLSDEGVRKTKGGNGGLPMAHPTERRKQSPEGPQGDCRSTSKKEKGAWKDGVGGETQKEVIGKGSLQQRKRGVHLRGGVGQHKNEDRTYEVCRSRRGKRRKGRKKVSAGQNLHRKVGKRGAKKCEVTVPKKVPILASRGWKTTSVPRGQDTGVLGTR